MFFSHNDSVLMNNVGFKDIDISIKSYNWSFENDCELLNFCKLLFGLNLCNNDDFLFKRISNKFSFYFYKNIGLFRKKFYFLFFLFLEKN